MAVCGGIWIVFGVLTQPCSDWIVVDISDVPQKILPVAHAMIGEAPLPDRNPRSHAVGEASFN